MERVRYVIVKIVRKVIEHTLLYLSLLALVHDELVELLLVLGGQVLQALGGLGADVELIHYYFWSLLMSLISEDGCVLRRGENRAYARM